VPDISDMEKTLRKTVEGRATIKQKLEALRLMQSPSVAWLRSVLANPTTPPKVVNRVVEMLGEMTGTAVSQPEVATWTPPNPEYSYESRRPSRLEWCKRTRTILATEEDLDLKLREFLQNELARATQMSDDEWRFGCKQ
jgi:hypothetical protein